MAELDKAVAEAIGMKEWYAKRFYPSTDLNDSFWAAEQVGLFKCKQHDLALVRGGCPEHWFMSQGEDDFVGVSEADTPALAICAAIIKLKGM